MALHPDCLEVALMCLGKRSRGKRGLTELPTTDRKSPVGKHRLRPADGPARAPVRRTRSRARAHLGHCPAPSQGPLDTSVSSPCGRSQAEPRNLLGRKKPTAQRRRGAQPVPAAESRERAEPQLRKFTFYVQSKSQARARVIDRAGEGAPWGEGPGRKASVSIVAQAASPTKAVLGYRPFGAPIPGLSFFEL